MANITFNWTCPYCGHAQAVGEAKVHSSEQHIGISDLAEGSLNLVAFGIGCANHECLKLTLTLAVRPDTWNSTKYEYNVDYGAPATYFQRALPRSDSKPQPEYIPVALREDYEEACLIRDDSPKAAATLARRCLQGMIRDFCEIQRATLDQEIKALHKAIQDGNAPSGVSPESVDAIDHVRKVGNIGAHMEKNIDLIIAVEPEEAQALIGLIEILFDEWYVAKETRTRRLAQIASISAEKQQAILDARSQATPDGEVQPEAQGTSA
jgi:hypothetical protein